jgi:hypothetical protein
LKKLLALYGGSSQHHRTLFEPKYKKYFSEIVYLLDLPKVDLKKFDGILIPSRINKKVLRKSMNNILQFLNDGKLVISFGENPSSWLPGVNWEFRPTNFWWWLDPEAKSGIISTRPEHELFEYITLENATWHYHGIFHPPDGSDTLIGTEDGKTILYFDKISTIGTMVITSLDPDFHFGSYFMPAAERFLDGFLPYISERLL